MPDPLSKDKETVNLNVISPSSAPICFRDLPISTSIAALKTKIWEASPVHPPPNVQRLIYRGHVVAQPERTMKEVFSQEIINDSEILTMHLITPPVGQQRQPTTPTPPNVPQHAPGPEQHARPPPPHVQQVTFSATFNGQPTALQFPQQAIHSIPAAVNQNNEQPQSAPDPQTPSQGSVAPPQPQGGPFPPINPHFQAHINAVQAQAHALLANQLAAMHQHPAFAGQLPMMGPNGLVNSGPQPYAPSQVQQRSPPHGPVRANQHIGNPAVPNTPHVAPHITSARQQISRPHSPSLLGTNPASEQQTRPGAGQEAISNQFRQLESPQQRADTRNFLHPPTLFPTAGVPGTAASTHMPYGNPTRASSTFPNSVPAIPQINAASHDARRTENPALYLLSSPSGPQALLVSPSGLFSTPWFAPPPVALAPTATSRLRYSPDPTASRLPGVPPSAPSASGSVPSPQLRRQPDVGQAQAPIIPGNPNPAHAHPEQRDVGRIAAQISSHIWMLVRLFGFIWFFSHGASTSRTVMLCLIGILVFFGQIGLFQGLWRRVRTRADNILHFGAPGQTNHLHAGRGTNHGAAGPNSVTPEQTAERLLAERRRQEGNAIRQALRRCERAAMLFFGSLAPGLAERHIQARNDAESARQREAQEREDRQKREEEARNGTAANVVQSNSEDNDNNAAGHEVRREVQPPQMEV